MSDPKEQAFQIQGISFPKVEANFLAIPTPEAKFDYSFRVVAQILSDKKVNLLFGIQLNSSETVENTPKARITVEAVGAFEFLNPLPIIGNISEIPLVANMLALLYPFIREKCHYCLSNNNIHVFLPPVNTIQLVKDNAQAFGVVDTRKTR